MNTKHLLSRDGEELDGFEELIETIDDPEYGPLVPTEKCKRCGCWLRADRRLRAEHRLHDDREKDQSEEPHPAREYCSSCQAYLRKHSKLCLMCENIFYSEDPLAIRCEKCERNFQKHKCVCAICGEEFLPYVCNACIEPEQRTDICHHCHWNAEHEAAARARERKCRICNRSFLPSTCIVLECGARLTDLCSTCHEGIEHMGMTAIVWTLRDCPTCEAVIFALKQRHRKVTRLSLEKLASGEEPDIDAMAHLAMTGGVAPIVFIDGRFLESDEINALISKEGDE